MTKIPPRRRGTKRSRSGPGACALVLLAAATGCVYDADDRCGTAMHYDAALIACVCDDDAIATATGCTPCAADEVVAGGACACPPGEAKDPANVCVPVVGLGDPCTSPTDCTNPTYGFCAPPSAGSAAGTCTSACTSDADCGAAYTCATWETQPYCRPYSGLGATCASSDDCAGNDAAFCDTFQSHTCIVAGCSLALDDCPRGLTCCDYTSFGLGHLCAEACQ